MPPTRRQAVDAPRPLLPLGSRVRIVRKRPYSGVPVGAAGRVMKHHRHEWPYEIKIEGTADMRYLFAIGDVAPINPQGDSMDDWRFKVGDKVVVKTKIRDGNYDIEAGTLGEIIEMPPHRTFPYFVRFDNGMEHLCFGNELEPSPGVEEHQHDAE